MMKTPTEVELNHFMHAVYDPVKAHQYYEKTKKLKGRRKGRRVVAPGRRLARGQDPRIGKKKEQIKREARLKQRQELAERIKSLEQRLQRLEDLIMEKEVEAASGERKALAKQERAAKEADKPATAAEKAEKARESEQYRKEHQAELEAKRAKKASETSEPEKKPSVSETATKAVSDLKVLATKAKGQIEVAKQKLAAL